MLSQFVEFQKKSQQTQSNPENNNHKTKTYTHEEIDTLIKEAKDKVGLEGVITVDSESSVLESIDQHNVFMKIAEKTAVAFNQGGKRP